MMEISWSAVYAIYAVHYLARNPGRYVTVHEIAEHGGIPEAFLANLIPDLRRKGILRARRGQGYALNRPAERISVFDIIVTVDGERAFPGACAMKSMSCGARDGCALASAWEGIHHYITDILGSVTIDRLPSRGSKPLCTVESHKN